MTEVFEQGPRAAEFILSEANGQRSRDNVTVKQGETLAAGEMFQLDETGDAVAVDATLDSNDALVTAIAGIMIYAVDASSSGTNADTPAAAIVRDAEVNGNLLTFPDESSAGGERAACVTSLAALGVIVRDETEAA